MARKWTRAHDLQVQKILADEPKANMILARGFAKNPGLPIDTSVWRYATKAGNWRRTS